MPIWLIPLIYLLLGMLAGFAVPRLEYAFFPAYSHAMSIATAQAYLSAIASGMMTLTAIVFSIIFLMMQFTASLYSKRIMMVFSNLPISLHALGIFFATFICALGVLQFVDRSHDGRVPLLSMQLVTGLLLLSMLLLTLLMQRVGQLRITYILQFIGSKGRAVIARTFPRLDDDTAELDRLRSMAHDVRRQPSHQRVTYNGGPKAIACFRIDEFVRLAEQSDGTIVLNCAVGDTVAQGTVLLNVYATTTPIPEAALLRGIVLVTERTFTQDPKYPFRLLVDTAIMALSPAVNDPTTAVQAIDQIEDLLQRLGPRVLDTGYVTDGQGKLRLIFPMPTWEEYLSLAFDEIRIYGRDALQVQRRLRAALADLEVSLTRPDRRGALRTYRAHLDAGTAHSAFDSLDQALASQRDPQGLGHTREPRA